MDLSQEPLPPPTNPEAMPEKIQSLERVNSQQLQKKAINESDTPDPEYPTTRRVIPIVVSLYMAFFLVGLVGLPL